jgi:hypothetical protein
MPSRFDIAKKSSNNSASTIGGKSIPNQIILKQKFESDSEELDRTYDSPEFQEQARQFIKDTSTITEKKLDQAMSTISKCLIIPALIIPKEEEYN